MKIAYSWTLEADLKVVVSPELNWFQGDRLVMLEGQDGFTVDEAYSSDVAASLCGYSVPATGFILWEKQVGTKNFVTERCRSGFRRDLVLVVGSHTSFCF